MDHVVDHHKNDGMIEVIPVEDSVLTCPILSPICEIYARCIGKLRTSAGLQLLPPVLRCRVSLGPPGFNDF